VLICGFYFTRAKVGDLIAIFDMENPKLKFNYFYAVMPVLLGLTAFLYAYCSSGRQHRTNQANQRQQQQQQQQNIK
jgi:membrane protein insertase Oxa1/YidC/SpoIIIJ